MTDKMEESVLLAIAEEIKRDEAKTAFLNPERVLDMRTVLSLLRCIRSGKDLSISYQLNAPFKSMGCITVEGRNITITDPESFRKAVDIASNVDIYPLANGWVCMDFTFHGLTKHISAL